MKSFFEWFKASTKVKRWIFLIILGIIAICYAMSRILVTNEMDFVTLGKLIAIFVVGFVTITISIIFIQKRMLELVIEANNVVETERSKKAKVSIKSLIFNKNVYEDGPKIVVVGGGEGLNTVIRGLKKYTNNLTAIVTMSDFAEESNDTLREIIDVIPSEEIKNSIISMSDKEELMNKLMNLKFHDGSVLDGFNFGDIYLKAMNGISNNISDAISKSTEVLNITGKVIPVTLDEITITADLADGTSVRTRKNLIKAIENKVVGIDRVAISPSNARPAPGVLEAIEEAEAIVVAPGSLYTSVLPTLLVRNVVKAIKESKALKIFVSNIMTEPGQTEGFTLSDHLKVIKDHIGVDLFDLALVDNGEVVPEYIRKYNKDGSEPVEVDNKNVNNLRIVERKLSTIVDGKIRHDPDVVAINIIEYICNELKFQDEQNSTEYILLESVLKEQRKKQLKQEKALAKTKNNKPILASGKREKKASKFKEKYKDRFASIKTADIVRSEKRKKIELDEKKKKSKGKPVRNPINEMIGVKRVEKHAQPKRNIIFKDDLDEINNKFNKNIDYTTDNTYIGHSKIEEPKKEEKKVVEKAAEVVQEIDLDNITVNNERENSRIQDIMNKLNHLGNDNNNN